VRLLAHLHVNLQEGASPVLKYMNVVPTLFAGYELLNVESEIAVGLASLLACQKLSILYAAL